MHFKVRAALLERFAKFGRCPLAPNADISLTDFVGIQDVAKEAAIDFGQCDHLHRRSLVDYANMDISPSREAILEVEEINHSSSLAEAQS